VSQKFAHQNAVAAVLYKHVRQHISTVADHANKIAHNLIDELKYLLRLCNDSKLITVSSAASKK
jgi:hypothetical protein